MSKSRKIPPFEQSIAAIVLGTKEAIIAPMRPKLREHGITEPQWRVMRVINDRGPTDATGLAEVGLLHAPSVTRILKELERRGLIVRTADVNDRRRTLVDLSPEGREMVKVISRDVMRILGIYQELFGEDRLCGLLAEMQALSGAIQRVE